MKNHIPQGIFFKALVTAFTLCFAPFAIADTKNTELPLFTPFNWAESNASFIIKGKACTHISKLGDLGCGPAIFVFDIPNKRLFMDLGKHGGQYYLLKDISYINEAIPGRGCFQVPGFTFASQVNGYQNVLSTPGSTPSKATYIGLALDVGSCKEKIAASMTVHQGFLTEWDYGQMFPVPGLGMQFVTGMITLDPNTIDTTSDRSHYFVMPNNCNNSAPKYCDTIYPPKG